MIVDILLEEVNHVRSQIWSYGLHVATWYLSCTKLKGRLSYSIQGQKLIVLNRSDIN